MKRAGPYSGRGIVSPFNQPTNERLSRGEGNAPFYEVGPKEHRHLSGKQKDSTFLAYLSFYAVSLSDTN